VSVPRDAGTVPRPVPSTCRPPRLLRLAGLGRVTGEQIHAGLGSFASKAFIQACSVPTMTRLGWDTGSRRWARASGRAAGSRAVPASQGHGRSPPAPAPGAEAKRGHHTLTTSFPAAELCGPPRLQQPPAVVGHRQCRSVWRSVEAGISPSGRRTPAAEQGPGEVTATSQLRRRKLGWGGRSNSRTSHHPPLCLAQPSDAGQDGERGPPRAEPSARSQAAPLPLLPRQQPQQDRCHINTS